MRDEMKEIEEADLVEMDFLEKVAARLPEDEDVLLALGDIYTRAGRYEDGLRIDRSLVKLMPEESSIWYNLACSLALLNVREEALASLRRAVELGYQDHEWMSCDSDLRNIRDEKAFTALLKTITAPKSNKSLDS
jgi:tetratricopeptide (TPR) repeat protein